MSCAWCYTWSSWAWTTKFKTIRRMRFDRLSFCQSCSYTHGAHLLILVQMVPGTLHWGALPWQLVPRHEPPLQFAPCHQLRESPCPWDSSWGEERDSTQHQHGNLFLWPGKKKKIQLSQNQETHNAFVMRSSWFKGCDYKIWTFSYLVQNSGR